MINSPSTHSLVVLDDVTFVDHDSLPLRFIQPVVVALLSHEGSRARVVCRQHNTVACHGGHARRLVVDRHLVEAVAVIDTAAEGVGFHVVEDFSLPLKMRVTREECREEKREWADDESAAREVFGERKRWC